MRDAPKTPYPFPDVPDHRQFPETIPWDTPISDLSGWWLYTECECGQSVAYPFRLMAAERGWKRTLRSVVPKLKCKSCGGRPSRVELVEYAGSNERQPGARNGRLVIIG